VRRRDHQRRQADVTVEFDHDPAAPRIARRAIRPLISDRDDPIAQAVEAVTSELVSNVVEHTIDGGTVRAWDPKPNKPFHLEVADHDPREPVSPTDPNDAGGRGLRIVSALSDDWGVEHDNDGKTVWADFNRP